MNNLTKLSYRIVQKSLHLAMMVMPVKEPQIISGDDGLHVLAKKIKTDGFHKVCIITQKPLPEMGLLKDLTDDFEKYFIDYVLFDSTQPNPTILQIEEARKLYLSNHCDCLLVFGGGSAMDLAKGVGARIARPKKTLQQMKGILKVRRKLPMLIAVPTTAGTGSEATLACVITDSETHHKYAINDHVLVPKIAVLCPKLTVGLPKAITSTTGMDALTHAVEAFIGHSNTRKTKRYALEAVKLVFDNLLTAYQEPNNLIARQNMQIAAYKAGVAFTRAYVGNVHAIAHTLGGTYGIPHGLANAVILPHVLEYYNHHIDPKLAILADYIHLTDSKLSVHEKSKAFVEAIKSLNHEMDIPSTFSTIIKDADVPLMISRAKAEANPLYPVPIIMDTKAFGRIYSRLQD